MPDDRQGKDDFEYEKKKSQPNYKTLGAEEELGDMHFSTENYSVALEYYEKALQKIHVAPQPAELLRIYRKISDCYVQKGLFREAATFLQSAESHCEEEDSFGKGTLACLRGVILRENGAIEKALHEASAAYRLLRTSDDHREVGRVQRLIATCYARLGRKDEAEQYFLDALSSYRRVDDAVGESYVLNSLGLFHKDACRFARANYFFARALELCDKLGLTQHRVRVTLNLGITCLKSRNFALAIGEFSKARKMSLGSGDDQLYIRATLMLGLAQARKSEFPAAEKHLLEARVIAERRGYAREIALADEYLGDLMVARGDLDGALENYSTSLARAKKMSLEGDIVAEVLRRETEVFLMQRKFEEVLSVGAKALDVAREKRRNIRDRIRGAFDGARARPPRKRTGGGEIRRGEHEDVSRGQQSVRSEPRLSHVLRASAREGRGPGASQGAQAHERRAGVFRAVRGIPRHGGMPFSHGPYRAGAQEPRRLSPPYVRGAAARRGFARPQSHQARSAPAARHGG